MRALRREREYISESEQNVPAEEQTVWLLRALDLDVYATVQDKLVQLVGSLASDAEPRTLVLSGTQEATVLVHGVAGWRNFKDEDGNDIPYPTRSRADRRRDDDDAFVRQLKVELSRIPPEVRAELSREILGRARLTERERGNSASLSASRAPGGELPAPADPTSAPVH